MEKNTFFIPSLWGAAQKAQRGVAAEKIPEKVLILAFNQKRAFHVHNPHSVCPLNITAVNLLMKLTGRHVLMSECEKKSLHHLYERQWLYGQNNCLADSLQLINESKKFSNNFQWQLIYAVVQIHPT